MSEEKKLKNQMRQLILLKKILSLIDQTQRGQGLKILTPHQMLHRLPITLAQLKTGNNTEKFKNETRQLLYSFYQLKKLTETIYNDLIDTI